MVEVALLCQGHVLLEDVPGLGKTMLVKPGQVPGLQVQPDSVYSGPLALRCGGRDGHNQKTMDFQCPAWPGHGQYCPGR